MTMLNPKKIPTHIESVTIYKLDNGYDIQADTALAGRVAHYCSNLKGVTKALWAFFEGKERIGKKQAEGISGVLETQSKKLSKGSETEEDNA